MHLKDILKYGSLRKRKDGISEYTIVSGDPVRLILLEILPYLKIKKSLAQHVLRIIECKRNINNDRELFIEACGLVDETITMTYSKKRTITKETVIKHLDSIKHK